MDAFLTAIASFILDTISSIGYFGITFLMAIESSFIPFPSEVVIPPAAYLAQQGEMNIILVVVAGIVGSLLGALLNYFLAYTLGRKIVYALVEYKVFKYLLIDGKKIARAENYFLKYGSTSTLIGRFVPAVRQLISIPAGFSKMSLKSFIFYTSFGSGIWVTILAVLGYFFGANQELLARYYGRISLFFIGLAVVLVIGLIIKKRWTKNH